MSGRTTRSLVVTLLGRSREPSMALTLDLSALVLDRDGQVLSDAHFVFFNHSVSPEGAVIYVRDRQIQVIPESLPASAQRVIFIASIDQAGVRVQSFRSLSTASIHLSRADGVVYEQHDLSAAWPHSTAVVVGQIVRKGLDWTFSPSLSPCYTAGLQAAVTDYGVKIAPW